MNNLLEIRNISKEFEGVTRLNNVSFKINSGDFLLIAGSNGSGKTLLMKHLNGLFKIKKGTIFFRGQDCYKKERDMKKRIGIVFQNPDTQIIGLSVKDDICFGPKNLGYSKDKIDLEVTKVMSRMNITHLKHRNPHTLSGGEKKRVNIAGILSMSPDIIILDEPFIGLDYPGVKNLIDALIQLKNEGETIIIITHDLEKITAYCNRMIVLFNGFLVADDKPQNIIDSVEKWGIRRPSQKTTAEMTWLK